jgi:hypothetical protein
MLVLVVKYCPYSKSRVRHTIREKNKLLVDRYSLHFQLNDILTKSKSNIIYVETGKC